LAPKPTDTIPRVEQELVRITDDHKSIKHTITGSMLTSIT